MRRYKLVAVLLLITTLTGCVQKYDYSEQQLDSASEYIAAVILRNDRNYTSKLGSFNKIIEMRGKKAAAAAPTQTGIDKVDADTEIKTASFDVADPKRDYTLTEVLGEDGFELEYTSYVIADSYPEDSAEAYFMITPRPEHQLVVASFMLKNTLNKNNNLNLTKANILYQLDVNEGTIYTPTFALVENNLKLIDVALKAKEEKPAVLIFEVKKDIDMKDINLMVTRDDRSETIKVK